MEEKVLIEDIEVAKTTVSKLCQKVGLVFQNPFNQLSGAKETVFEEIAFGLQNFGVPKEEMISRVDEVMELLDIAAYRDRNPFDLSGGQNAEGCAGRYPCDETGSDRVRRAYLTA